MKEYKFIYKQFANQPFAKFELNDFYKLLEIERHKDEILGRVGIANIDDKGNETIEYYVRVIYKGWDRYYSGFNLSLHKGHIKHGVLCVDKTVKYFHIGHLSMYSDKNYKVCQRKIEEVIKNYFIKNFENIKFVDS